MIERLALGEAIDGSGPTVVSREVLVEHTTLSSYNPEPLGVRLPPPVSERTSTPGPSTGTLHHQGLPVIDALLAHLQPAGSRPVRDDIVAVRLVEALPLGPEERQPLDDAPEAWPDATSTGLGGTAPARVLAELPLAADGTFQAEIPAGVPFRLQPLDAEGMAVGYPHNRWFFLAPGQVLKQGVRAPGVGGVADSAPDAYGNACAACHGALDGDPTAVFTEPDVLTTASLTLARYDGGNPRRPLAPTTVGETTRIEVDWGEDVLPVLAVTCGGCHAEQAPALSDAPTERFDTAYEALFDGGYVVPGSAAESPLVQRLQDGHGGLTASEILTVIRWIDLGATWRGAW